MSAEAKKTLTTVLVALAIGIWLLVGLAYLTTRAWG